MAEKYFITLKEAQELYGVEKTTFVRPRYAPDDICGWCGKFLDNDNDTGFCNRKCKSMYKVNIATSGANMYRLSLLYRDDFTCQNCRQKHRVVNEYGMELPVSDGQLDLHHIVSKAKGGSDAPDNLVTWCKNCHDAWHELNNDGFIPGRR